jgi:hypothetical protein
MAECKKQFQHGGTMDPQKGGSDGSPSRGQLNFVQVANSRNQEVTNGVLRVLRASVVKWLLSFFVDTLN